MRAGLGCAPLAPFAPLAASLPLATCVGPTASGPLGHRLGSAFQQAGRSPLREHRTCRLCPTSGYQNFPPAADDRSLGSPHRRPNPHPRRSWPASRVHLPRRQIRRFDLTPQRSGRSQRRNLPRASPLTLSTSSRTRPYVAARMRNGASGSHVGACSLGRGLPKSPDRFAADCASTAKGARQNRPIRATTPMPRAHSLLFFDLAE